MAIPVDLRVGTNIQNFKLTCTDLDSSPRSLRYSIGSGTILGFPQFWATDRGEGQWAVAHTDEGTVWAWGA